MHKNWGDRTVFLIPAFVTLVLVFGAFGPSLSNFSLDDTEKIASIIESIAVIISVIYVAVQIRLNTKATKSATYQSIIGSFADIETRISADKELARIVRAGRNGEVLNLDEQLQFNNVMSSFFNVHENLYYQYCQGLLDEELWKGWDGNLSLYLSRPGSRVWWDKTGHLYTVVAFVACFALLIAIVLQRLISGRLIRLTQLTSNFATRGDYTLRAPPMGDDEIGQLASAANRMLEEIARRQAEIHRGKQASDFLARTTAALVESLEADAMVRRLATLAVPFLGDWCLVHTLEVNGTIRCAAAAHVDDVGEPLVAELAAATPPSMDSMHPVSLVLESGQPLLLAELSEEHVKQLSPDGDARLIRTLGTRSVMVVPMVVRDQALGALTFASCTPGRKYDPDDLRLACELAQRAAFALDNARHFHDTQEALQMRETFLSIAAHELRTPLTALKLRLQAMARAARPSHLPESGDTPPPSTPVPPSSAPSSTTMGKDIVAGATRQVDRLGLLVNQLLEITRLAKGTLVLERQRVDLREVITEIEEQLGYEIERAASTFELTMEGDLDGNWDRLRLEQVIINLLTNALKFGKGKPISLSVTERDGYVRLVVRDEGLGIAKDAQKRIFGPFERAVSAANYGGLGLGLYITKQIVDAHGGTLQVESELGRGATFTVELPRYADELPDSAPEPITHVSLFPRRAS